VQRYMAPSVAATACCNNSCPGLQLISNGIACAADKVMYAGHTDSDAKKQHLRHLPESCPWLLPLLQQKRRRGMKIGKAPSRLQMCQGLHDSV